MTEKLRIWLIKEGETLPVNSDARLMRTGALAEYLARQGHKVTWWSSSFVHQGKKYVTKRNELKIISENERLVLLHSPISYQKNISVSRIIYHKLLSRQFRRLAKKFTKPDIILCSYPNMEFPKAALDYGKRYGVPVILDARDQWPDLFIRALPKPLWGIGNIIISPLKGVARRLFSEAYGITGMIESITRWACLYAGREPGDNDKTIYIGNRKVELDVGLLKIQEEWWREKGITPNDWIICFFGTFSSVVAVDILIKAVMALSASHPDIRLVLGGGGDREKELRDIAGDCNNIVFAGWLNNYQMVSLMKVAKCGALSYKNTFDFKDAFGNKAIQYLSEELPILNSLSGFAKTFISERDMGLTYESDDVHDCMRKILELYEDEDKRKALGRNGLHCFREMFDSVIVNKQFEDYLISMRRKYISEKHLKKSSKTR